MKYTKTFLILTALFGGLQSSLTYADNPTSSKEQKMTMESKQEQQIIYLAGGCFWGLEAYMERIQGVTDAVSGYANGKGDTTNYQLLHATEHAETVKVTYDPNKISLDKLLQYYFRVIDQPVLTSKAMIVADSIEPAFIIKTNKIKPLLKQH